jgi:hypothetical protein
MATERASVTRNGKTIDERGEVPAPPLTPAQRQQLWRDRHPKPKRTPSARTLADRLRAKKKAERLSRAERLLNATAAQMATWSDQDWQGLLDAVGLGEHRPEAAAYTPPTARTDELIYGTDVGDDEDKGLGPSSRHGGPGAAFYDTGTRITKTHLPDLIAAAIAGEIEYLDDDHVRRSYRGVIDVRLVQHLVARLARNQIRHAGKTAAGELDLDGTAP